MRQSDIAETVRRLLLLDNLRTICGSCYARGGYDKRDNNDPALHVVREVSYGICSDCGAEGTSS